MTRAFVAIGSNLGDRVAHLQAAVDGLRATPGVSVLAISPIYETDPVGPPQPDYYNAVVALDATCGAIDLLRCCLAIEDSVHRVREERWGPRTLDCDVLLFGDEVHDTAELTVPHPRLWERPFVTVPLTDVAPGVVPADVAAQRDGVRPTGLTLQ
ncbi:MAG: 2-amino-4-hydroxy-6-hydroxymethyldihydropteridine diphosphokinase [Acidimicrobiia bacterium]